jgi:hypothetical protein
MFFSYRKISLVFILILSVTFLQAQNIAITDSSSYEAKPSAVLDVQSSSKGMLIPRMGSEQRIMMANPANGLLVFDTTMNSFFYYQYDQWVSLTSFNPNAGLDETLFHVVNANGDTVFAVYNDGVEITVDESSTGTTNGFKVSGRDQATNQKNRYLSVTPDSTSIIINQDKVTSKDKVGGFAISGRSANKGVIQDMFFTTLDSTRVYVDQGTAKDKVGGFAISGRSANKGNENTYFDLGEKNYFVGKGAGASITTGTNNSFLGFNAGYLTETGSDNIFLGYHAGYNNIGHLESSPTPALDGSANVFIGKESGKYNIDGSNNVMVGNQTGFNNESGLNNVFIGNLAGFSNIGNGSYNGDYNVFIGNKAGENNTEGATNVFIGERAGLNNTIGGSNVYIGRESGRTDTSGVGNTYVGRSSGSSLRGTFNTAIGDGAGAADANSYKLDYNTLIGKDAGNDLITGKQNTIIGSEAGAFIDEGRRNVIIGAEAGVGTGSGINNPGSNNVFIGYQAGMYETDSNKLYIENSSGTPLIYGDFASDYLVINGTANNSYNFFVSGDAGGTGTWNALSDRRLKENISPISNSLDKVLQMEGVNFEWKDKDKYGKKKEIGFIAQDVEKVLPEVVNKKGEHYSIQYGEVNAVLVEAVKEQQKMIKKLEKRISDLEEKIDSIE